MGDIIKQIIDGIGNMTAKMLGKEPISKVIIINEEIQNSYDLYEVIFQLLEDKKICKAEDLLFSELDKGFTEGKYLVGIEFYEKLKEFDDNTLKQNNFSKDEIVDGLKALKKIKKENTDGA